MTNQTTALLRMPGDAELRDRLYRAFYANMEFCERLTDGLTGTTSGVARLIAPANEINRFVDGFDLSVDTLCAPVLPAYANVDTWTVFDTDEAFVTSRLESLAAGREVLPPHMVPVATYANSEIRVEELPSDWIRHVADRADNGLDVYCAATGWLTAPTTRLQRQQRSTLEAVAVAAKATRDMRDRVSGLAVLEQLAEFDLVDGTDIVWPDPDDELAVFVVTAARILHPDIPLKSAVQLLAGATSVDAWMTETLCQRRHVDHAAYLYAIDSRELYGVDIETFAVDIAGGRTETYPAPDVRKLTTAHCGLEHPVARIVDTAAAGNIDTADVAAMMELPTANMWSAHLEAFATRLDNATIASLTQARMEHDRRTVAVNDELTADIWIDRHRRTAEVYSPEGAEVASMLWSLDGEIENIQVADGYKRQGVATALFNTVTAFGVPVRHSENRTELGDLWACSLGAEPVANHLHSQYV